MQKGDAMSARMRKSICLPAQHLLLDNQQTYNYKILLVQRIA